jgi:hypothetical protein
LTLSALTTVAKGAPITFSGVLGAGAEKLSARNVTLSFRKRNAKAYTPVAMAKTDAVGRFTLQRTAVTTGVWKIAYAGSSEFRPATASKAVTVTAVGDKLLSSFTNIVGWLDPYNQIAGEVGDWSSRRYDQDISRTYKVTWSFSCRAAVVSWHLFWMGGAPSGEDNVDIVWTDAVGSGSGTYLGHDGWDGDPWTSFDKYLKLEIWGDNSRSCSSTIKIYNTGRVPV